MSETETEVGAGKSRLWPHPYEVGDVRQRLEKKMRLRGLLGRAGAEGSPGPAPNG